MILEFGHIRLSIDIELINNTERSLINWSLTNTSNFETIVNSFHTSFLRSERLFTNRLVSEIYETISSSNFDIINHNQTRSPEIESIIENEEYQQAINQLEDDYGRYINMAYQNIIRDHPQMEMLDP